MLTAVAALALTACSAGAARPSAQPTPAAPGSGGAVVAGTPKPTSSESLRPSTVFDHREIQLTVHAADRPQQLHLADGYCEIADGGHHSAANDGSFKDVGLTLRVRATMVADSASAPSYSVILTAENYGPGVHLSDFDVSARPQGFLGLSSLEHEGFWSAAPDQPAVILAPDSTLQRVNGRFDVMLKQYPDRGSRVPPGPPLHLTGTITCD